MTQHEDNTIRTMCTRANHDVNCPCHIRTQEPILKEFDETFGYMEEGEELSTGEGAGCDDCPGDQRAREEHKQFLIKHLSLQRQQILSDLIKIANQGEYEDMRREIERYNNL